MPDTLLTCVNLRKYFGAVRAVDGVSLSVEAGSVVGLVGDNGAGKSTLIRILSGLHRPDVGEIYLNGVRVSYANAAEAQRLGTYTVHQNLLLCDNLGAAANIDLGHEPVRLKLGPFSIVDDRRSRREAFGRLREIGVSLPDIDGPVRQFSGGQRQGIALARALARGCRLLILDEPTAALGVRQARATLDLITRLRDQGLAIILISHSLEDVFSAADRIVALRLGRVVFEGSVANTTREDLAICMMG